MSCSRSVFGRFQYRDKVLTIYQENGSSDSEEEEEDDVQDFTAAEWPVTHEATREELEELMDTHRIRPIPVWDENCDIVKPDAYRRCLEEATVEVHFTLTHWPIAGKRGSAGSDTFVGEIDTMRVLIPAQVISRGGNRKRKLKQKLVSGSSASKRQNVMSNKL